MSVPVNKRSQGKLEVAIDAKELAVYTLHITNNSKEFPVSQNDEFIQKIRGLATTIYSKVWAANNILVNDLESKNKRLQLQKDACVDCNTLLPLIDIACSLYHQRAKRLKHWTTMIVNVRNQIRTWHESELKRYSEIK